MQNASRNLEWLLTKRKIAEETAQNTAFKWPDMRLSRNTEKLLTIEHFPINCSYGCRIDRKSNVTIVAPTCPSEYHCSNTAYKLALFGGFNFISREIIVDYDDITSYYNVDCDIVKDRNLADVIDKDTKISDFYNENECKKTMRGKVKSDAEVKDKAERIAIQKRNAIVQMYLNDIRRYSQPKDGKEQWVIFFIATAKRSKTNDANVWLIDHADEISGIRESGSKAYEAFCNELTTKMKDEFELDFCDGNKRHKLVIGEGKSNAGLLLQENGAAINTFTMRVGPAVRAETGYVRYIYRMAEIINNSLNPGGCMREEDIDAWTKVQYGYPENDLENADVFIYE